MNWRELTIENPLLMEYRRAVRRFFGVSKSSAVNGVLLVISCLLYGLLLLITITNREGMPPVAVVMLQTLLFCFLIPANLHGSIAGERERRSWDLLLAAPVTNTQIVVGKLMGGLAAIATLILLMLPPMLITLAGATDFRPLNLLGAELISIGFAFCVAAIAIFVSARSKRTYGAHLTIYALLAMWLIVYVVFAYTLGGQAESTLYLHPFMALVKTFSEDGATSFLDSGVVHFLIYVAVGLLLIGGTINSLQAADGEDGRAR